MRLVFLSASGWLWQVAFALCLVGGQLDAQIQQAVSPEIVERVSKETPAGRVTTGRFRVSEDATLRAGRQIHLNFVVLHASGQQARPDPFFFFVGGPGQAATSLRARFRNHWIRQERDIVLIDQRGTGGDNRLAFQFPAGEESLQQYLDPIMELENVRQNRDRLSQIADLRMYSTPVAMDDINEFRKSMGYGKINIAGGSYGTRACLVYMRRHGETVRTAKLAGCAPIEFRNPLFHAQGAQRALEMMFQEVESSDQYRDVFGNLRQKFDEIISQLDEQPAIVEIANQSTGEPEQVQMNRSGFLASVRFQMYYRAGSRDLPRLLCDAHEGNFRPFVLSALRQNISLRQSIALGMLLSVTSAEDVARIDPGEVDRFTRDTCFGDERVRSQLAAAAIWPHSELPDDHGEPVRSSVPTLILSGSIDPVTPPEWGELIHENFPNSLHLVFPTAHDIGGPCVDHIHRQLLDSAEIEKLDTTCLANLKIPPFRLRQ